MAERPLRICDVCGEVDDLPRHVVAHSPGEVPVNTDLVVTIASRDDLDPVVRESIVADIIDTSLELRHMHCCAGAGCPDGSCNALVASGVSPDAMLAHIQEVFAETTATVTEV